MIDLCGTRASEKIEKVDFLRHFWHSAVKLLLCTASSPPFASSATRTHTRIMSSESIAPPISTEAAAEPITVEAGPSSSTSKPANGKQQRQSQANQLRPRHPNNNGGGMPRLTSQQLRKRLHYITSGSTVILRMPSGRTKAAEINPGKQVSLGKFGSFKADDLIGMPYGFTYEIQQDPSTAQDTQQNGKGSGKKGAASSGNATGGSLKLVINRTLETSKRKPAKPSKLLLRTNTSTMTDLLKSSPTSTFKNSRTRVFQAGRSSNSSLPRPTALPTEQSIRRPSMSHVKSKSI